MKNSVLTPLQEMFWERENLINKLYDRRICKKRKESIVSKCLELTNKIKILEGVKI